MARRLLIPILLGLAALTGAARAGAEEERLLVAVPDDWTIVPSVEQGQVRLEQFLPPGQSADDWVEMVMVVTHLGAGEMDPAATTSALVEASEVTCGETAMAPRGSVRSTAGQWWLSSSPAATPSTWRVPLPWNESRRGARSFERLEQAQQQPRPGLKG